MPVILSQKFIGEEKNPKYRDVKRVIYHYPRIYFSRVLPGGRFIYYRPIKGSTAVDAGTYFGHGQLGVPFTDIANPNYVLSIFEDISNFQSLSVSGIRRILGSPSLRFCAK